jgi:hypothetical protein
MSSPCPVGYSIETVLVRADLVFANGPLLEHDPLEGVMSKPRG